MQITDTIKEYQKRECHLHIAIAPTKMNERFEFFLEKCTEIGIDEITPITCENSERRVIKKERLERVILSAIKQSLKAYMPKINNLTPINEFISLQTNTIKKYIAHCKNDPCKKAIKEVL